MDVRHELHPKVIPNNTIHLPLACYTMPIKEKDILLTILRKLKVPNKYVSNIS